MHVGLTSYMNQPSPTFVFLKNLGIQPDFKSDDVAPVNCFYFINHLIFCKKSSI